ncbi:MAG: hypothetical protein EBX40_06990, partial [Gammaproteobacteria bacterium]|nr:hypothetical protein [Gammaproteobacteria bacterium]
KQLFDLFSSRIRFTNVYGPTECTCICTAYEVGAQDFSTLEGILPLGAMNPNFGFLILDDSGRPVSQGELGELCLLGPCVGRGYYGQMELTAKAFKQNPNQSHLTEWMYCTGDLVVQHPKTQTLHFVARKDNQIKYQGYRIELDEIESAFYTLPYVNEAAVIYIQDPESPPGKIKAVVSVQGEIDESRIIQDLRARLPEYMLPRRIFFQSELPKNKNGKVDRVTLTREYEVA